MNIKTSLIVFLILSSACAPESSPSIETAPVAATMVVPADTIVPATHSGNGAVIPNCPLFPADNIWNTRARKFV